jgi:polyisoprenoid-binding protein YceI
MPPLRRFAPLLLLPGLLLAAPRALKIDRTRTFVDIDVKATVDSFTGHLDAHDTKIVVDDAGKIKTATLSFRFADLKTGKAERDHKMIEWLGGGEPDGRFELGNLAVTPDGQGQASGRLTFHGITERIEFPIHIVKADGTYTITGETTIDYRHWNLKVIRIAMMLKVDPEVKIRFKFTGVPVVEPAQ